MAIQTRYAGDARGINNFDPKTDGTLGYPVAIGLTKAPIALSVVAGSGQSFTAADTTTGNAVETILRAIAVDSTITMYQVNAGSISVLLEATGAGGDPASSDTNEGAAVITGASIATGLQNRIQALPANISVTAGNIWANTTTVVGSVNFKLATS